MIIKIGEKNYDNRKWEMVDCINNFEWQEFIYYTETLYKTPDDEYVLHTMYQLNPDWHQKELIQGDITSNDILPKDEYRILSDEKAGTWIDASVCEV